MAKPIFIKVDGAGPYDPAAGAFDCNIPYIKGMDIYLENVNPALYTVLSTGGFRMLSAFVADAEFFVHLSGIAYGNENTSYTNGFCLARVQAALFGRLGWMQPAGADQPVLNSTNLISRSGRKFNDTSFHAIVTLMNVKSVMEQADASDADFNAFLEGLQRAVNLRFVNAVFSPAELISQNLLYTRWGYQDTPVANTGKFIAWRIKVPPVSDLAVKINSVSLFFDTNCTFNLYLFNDAKKAPVWLGEVSAVANTQTVVTLTDIVLNHIGGANMGGIFYFGYFQNDLGAAKAIRESASNFKTKMAYSATMIEVHAIGANDFERTHIGYSSFQTYGLNLDISVFRDHTVAIERQAALFDNGNGLQMAAQIGEMIMYTKRSNGEQRILQDATTALNASLDITGTAPISDGPQSFGLRQQVLKEITRVKDSFFPKQKPISTPLC